MHTHFEMVRKETLNIQVLRICIKYHLNISTAKKSIQKLSLIIKKYT